MTERQRQDKYIGELFEAYRNYITLCWIMDFPLKTLVEYKDSFN